MSDDRDSQLSAMFDDELPEAECELLARRLARDEALKAQWGRYAVIGAAIRAERGVRLGSRVARRVSAALSAEPALAVDAAPVRRATTARGGVRWWQPLAGVGVAAGVAAVSILWLRAQAPVGEAPLIAQSSGVQLTAASAVREPESYVVPAVVERPVAMPTAELANYVVAHSEFSTPLSRRNMLSALVASEAGGAAGAVQSEDQVIDARDDDAQAAE